MESGKLEVVWASCSLGTQTGVNAAALSLKFIVQLGDSNRTEENVSLCVLGCPLALICRPATQT